VIEQNWGIYVELVVRVKMKQEKQNISSSTKGTNEKGVPWLVCMFYLDNLLSLFFMVGNGR
jgi:hypothetical protein